MTDAVLWVLGAPDPEMEAIEGLLRDHGQEFRYAVDAAGNRVHPGNAYKMAPLAGPLPLRVIYVECDTDPPAALNGKPWVSRCDHHRPGDPGYGAWPGRFLDASSIGQVYGRLVGMRSGGSEDYSYSYGHRGGDWAAPIVWYITDNRGAVTEVPHDIVLAAAADHCLGAAYRGECPGVDPDELMQWRAAERARFQGRKIEHILGNIRATMAALRDAPEIEICYFDEPGGPGSESWERSGTVVYLRDMRRTTPWPELPEAATRLGIGYVSGPLASPDGRRKYTVSGSKEEVLAWMELWAPHNRLTDIYGDPARGFAGGYER